MRAGPAMGPPFSVSEGSPYCGGRGCRLVSSAFSLAASRTAGLGPVIAPSLAGAAPIVSAEASLAAVAEPDVELPPDVERAPEVDDVEAPAAASPVAFVGAASIAASVA